MELKFNLVGSGTWVMEIDGKFKIGCDPGLSPKGAKFIYKGLKTERLLAPVYSKNTFDNVKLWILTHGHFDHFDENGMKFMKHNSKIVANKNCSKLLNKREDLKANYLDWNEKVEFEIDGYRIQVEAIKAIHGMNLLAKILMGGVNGYFITLTKGNESKRIYATSDTVFLDDIISTINGRKVDVLIANMGQAKSKMFGGPFTMNEEMLDKFIRELKPSITFPIHTDDFAHFETNRNAIKNRNVENKFIVLDNGDSYRVK